MLNSNKDIDRSISNKASPNFLIEIIESLEPFVDFKQIKVNTRFTFSAADDDKCYLVRSGTVSIYRQPDNILFEIFDAPCIRGVISFSPENNSIFILKVIAPSEIAIVKREVLFQLFTRHALWEKFALHLLGGSGIIVEKLFKLTTPAAYDVVRYQLYELINMSLEARESIVASEYICGKTRLSRSRVMRILSDLKEGGYIVIERGILKSISSLPKQY